MKRAAGFTLIELLVVIGIIAILAAILFPVFSSVRAKARQMTCLSNMRQIGMAILMYAQDNDDQLPPSAHRLPGGGGMNSRSLIWPAYVAPYVKSTRVFVCPLAEGVSSYATTWGERGRLSIGLNRDIENRFTNLPYSLVVFDDPSITLLLADSTPGETNAPQNGRGFQVQADRAPNTQSGIGERHNRGTNVGFLDGHAKWYSSSAIWQLNNPAGLRWQP